MAFGPRDVLVQVADRSDIGELASLRCLWKPGAEEPDFGGRMAAWLRDEGDRRTTWLARLSDSAVGMASVFEYRRMPRPGRPDSRWGYIGSMFVREDVRNLGIGSALLVTMIDFADGRGYARLVLSPSPRAVPLFRRNGFIVSDERSGEDRLLVRPIQRGAALVSPPPP
ncbi:MAG: GNAT family N-acetyltransferase [Actinomycetota bacterium]|nr:GNAT family N-acetyltransferase [Actinomycetota bacterium]